MKAAGRAVRVEGEITAEGHLRVELPPELPRGRVAVTLEPLPEESLDLPEEDLKGLGLTAAEIAASPEIGAWAEEREVSGAEYVESLRGTSPRYAW